MDHYIPSLPSPGNPAVMGLMKSSEMRALMREKAELVEALYREFVAKRTGQLARSTRIETHIGGVFHDRWEATILVGSGLSYALPHEFGFDDGDIRIYTGHRDLNRALDAMGGMQ